MNDLKNSVAFLFFFLLLLFGVAQVNYVEENVINFSPVFFVLITVAVITGILIQPTRRLSLYPFLIGWAVIYGLTWVFYWRNLAREPVQVLLIQFLLVEIAAGLAFEVGRQISHVSGLLKGLAARTFPNRTIEIKAAEDRISAELTRSRRYHHPLSILILHVERLATEKLQNTPVLQRDILSEFASAKIGQIINEEARETDLIMRDEQGRFTILCPETNREDSLTLARRIEQAVTEMLGAQLAWGSAFFPGEALTFEDLVLKAEERLEEGGRDEMHPAALEKYVEDPAGVGENSAS
ncbi:MAG: GGDEF domain-containing protein [Bacteroidota bacterium]